MGIGRVRQVKKPHLRTPGKLGKGSKQLVIEQGSAFGLLKVKDRSEKVLVTAGRYDVEECPHPLNPSQPSLKIFSDPRGAIYLIIATLASQGVTYWVEDKK